MNEIRFKLGQDSKPETLLFKEYRVLRDLVVFKVHKEFFILEWFKPCRFVNFVGFQ